MEFRNGVDLTKSFIYLYNFYLKLFYSKYEKNFSYDDVVEYNRFLLFSTGRVDVL
jgi:hypothetical protein